MKSHEAVPTVVVSCDVCLKEIPRSAAMTAEGADYVTEFCGLECYQEFLKEAAPAVPPALPDKH